MTRSQVHHDAIGVMLESRATDLLRKGSLEFATQNFNPEGTFGRTIILTPYKTDLEIAPIISRYGLEIRYHGGRIGRPFSLPIAAWRLRKIIRGEDIRVLRCSNIFFGCLFGSLIAKSLGVASLAWVGGDNRLAQRLNGRPYYGSRIFTNYVERTALRIVDVVVVPNHFTQRYVRSILPNSRELHCEIIPWVVHRVERASFANSRAMEVESIPEPYVTTIGFVNRYKYSDVLFDMLKNGPITVGDRRVTVVFCGDGELAADGRRLFEQRADVKFTGFVSRTQVDAILSNSKIVLVPVSGFVILEAASLAKPVIAGNVEWHSEIIENDLTGILVDPSSPQEWRKAITMLLNDEERAGRLGRELKGAFEARYAPETVASSWENLLMQLKRRPRE